MLSRHGTGGTIEQGRCKVAVLSGNRGGGVVGPQTAENGGSIVVAAEMHANLFPPKSAAKMVREIVGDLSAVARGALSYRTGDVSKGAAKLFGRWRGAGGSRGVAASVESGRCLRNVTRLCLLHHWTLPRVG